MLAAGVAVVVVVACAGPLASAGLSVADEAPPPPAPLNEPPPATDERPVEPLTPESPPPVLTPAPDPARPRIEEPNQRAPARKKTKATAAESEGLNDVMIGFLQWLVPCGIAGVGIPCAGIAFYFCPPGAVCGICLLPAANGYLATYIGDRFGQNRAPAIWPVIAAYASTTIAVIGSVAVLFALNGGLGNFNAPGNPVLLGVLATGAGVSIASTLAVPLAYTLSSEPKVDGDDGDEAPGWFAPNHPKPRKKKRPSGDNDTPPPLTAMRF